MTPRTSQTVGDEWITFPGGELEGKRPKALCAACRDRVKRAAAGVGRISRQGTLCFQCYRAELDREHALRAAGDLDTASAERFQFVLPFEPINRPRLGMLKADRAAARASMQAGIGAFTDRRRLAQIAARHALRSIAAGLSARAPASPAVHPRHGADGVALAWATAVHAAELQLPEAWLPFVVAR